MTAICEELVTVYCLDDSAFYEVRIGGGQLRVVDLPLRRDARREIANLGLVVTTEPF